MAKFGRTYKLTVLGQDNKIHTIGFPITCVFDIERHNFSSANTAKFSLYGLSEDSRKQIYYDAIFQKNPIPITFSAGYSSQTPSLTKIFHGNVKFAYTERVGPELVTHIEALDGGFSMNTSLAEIPSGDNWNFTVTMKKLMKRLDGVTVGQVLFDSSKKQGEPGGEPLPGKYNTYFSGKAWDVLQEYTPRGKNNTATLFIDNNTVHMVGQNMTLPSPGIQILGPSNGLIGIPRKKGSLVECQSIFEPGIIINQRLGLVSSVVNGPFSVTGVHHSGTISGVESGTVRTDLALFDLGVR